MMAKVKATFDHVHKRHIIFIDMYLLALLILGLASEWLEFKIGIFVSAGLLILDFISSLIQINRQNEDVSIDSDAIYNHASQRNTDLSQRYQSVLMREKDLRNTSIDISQQLNDQPDVHSQASLFDTKNSNDGGVGPICNNS